MGNDSTQVESLCFWRCAASVLIATNLSGRSKILRNEFSQESEVSPSQLPLPSKLTIASIGISQILSLLAMERSCDQLYKTVIHNDSSAAGVTWPTVLDSNIQSKVYTYTFMWLTVLDSRLLHISPTLEFRPPTSKFYYTIPSDDLYQFSCILVDGKYCLKPLEVYVVNLLHSEPDFSSCWKG